MSERGLRAMARASLIAVSPESGQARSASSPWKSVPAEALSMARSSPGERPPCSARIRSTSTKPLALMSKASRMRPR